MRRAMRDLHDNLSEFAAQDDYGMLVLGCEDRDVPMVLKALDALDQEDHADLFFAVAVPFADESRWVNEVAALLRAHAEAANARRRRRGEPALPDLPPRALDAAAPPRDRLVAMFEHLHGLVPAPAEQRVVVALLPVELRDPAGYARLMATLTPHHAREPWMDGARLVVRDARGDGPLASAVRRRDIPGVLTAEVDFGVDALTAGLRDDAADPSVPRAERMAALLQLAMIDHGYQRHREAVAKYQRLYAYFGEVGAPSMQALCQLGVGDALRGAGQPAKALARYRSGVAEALDARAMPVLLNLLLAAGEACAELGDHTEAAGYFENAAKVASATMNPRARADASERQGDMLRAAGRAADAVPCWKDAADVARTFAYPEREASALERQRGCCP